VRQLRRRHRRRDSRSAAGGGCGDRDGGAAPSCTPRSMGIQTFSSRSAAGAPRAERDLPGSPRVSTSLPTACPGA
jgi:hypothetical protein